MKKLIIKFLGTGSAFARQEDNYQSNILIGRNNKMVYDCGSTYGEACERYKVDVNEVKSIFISHLHADHIGGLEEVAFRSLFGPNPRVDLYIRPELVVPLWESLKPGLDTIDEPATLETFFNVKIVNDWDSHQDQYIPFETDHANMKSYGLMIITLNSKVMITGDTKFDLGLISKYKESDIIFQDCDFNKYPGGVHAQFHELCTLPIDIKSKMHLYHYDIKALGMTFIEANQMVQENGFACLVKRGQEFTID